MKEVLVRMGEYKVLMSCGILKTVGLGSCVGVTLYDPFVKVGGLAHILLPRAGEGRRRTMTKRGAYADMAIQGLIREMRRYGASPSRIWARIAGGGEMFDLPGNSPGIGRRNVSFVKAELHREGIPLLGEDTGGDRGRAMRLDVLDGSVYVLRVGDEREFRI